MSRIFSLSAKARSVRATQAPLWFYRPYPAYCSQEAEIHGCGVQFMVFNYCLTHAALVGLKTVLRSPILQISNTTVPAGERFYDVPVSEAVIINMLV